MPRPQPYALGVAYKIYADNELCFAPVAAFYFGEASSEGLRALLCWVAIPLMRLLLLLLHWVAGWGGLLVHLLWMLPGMRIAAAGVDRRWHGRGGSALVRMRRRTELGIAGIGVLVRRRPPKRLLTWIHGHVRRRGGRVSDGVRAGSGVGVDGGGLGLRRGDAGGTRRGGAVGVGRRSVGVGRRRKVGGGGVLRSDRLVAGSASRAY